MERTQSFDFGTDVTDRPLVVPPSCTEAEEAVLGGILLDPAAMDIVAVLLEPEAFYFNSHKTIYGAAKSLHESGQPVNMITITLWLSDRDLLAQIGGRSKIASLVDRTVSAVNIDALAELIMVKYQRRQLISAGDAISRSAFDPYKELPECLEEAEAKIFEISQKQGGDRYTIGSAPEMAIELFEQIEAGKLQGEKLGWYDLEHLTGGVHKSMLHVVAAESSMGKTHYMTAIAHDIMKVLNLPVLYITPEMSKVQINVRLLAKMTGVDSEEILNHPERHWDGIAKGIAEMGQLPWKVFDHSSPTVQLIASNIRRAITEFGCPLGAVFIDYLQQIPLQNNGNTAFEVGKTVRGIRDIAKYHNIPIYLGSQINRSNTVTQDKRPNRHMLRGSGEIFEVCDQLVMLYRPSVYSKDPSDNTIELIVEKNRITGKVGTATMLCDFRTSTFKNMAR